MAKAPARPQPAAPIRSAAFVSSKPSETFSIAPASAAISSEPAAPVQAQPAAPESAEQPPETAEVVQASTRYGFPVYVPTQKKLIAPNDVVPLILDAWVRNQLDQERGALVRSKL